MAMLGLTLTPAAHAGARFNNSDFYIDSEGHYASGMVSGVRNTADTVARIECGITATFDNISMFCWGQNAAQKSVTCFSSRPALVQAAATIQSESTIVFYWNEAGECTYLSVLVESATAPKTP
ncbi:hypothetical protein [Pendulispora albinea]|uniref:Secreted protein n=1 Tax=Pendulispora albinea TaxID=2741071 RepID=A0ABZ2M220_9BACT